MELFMRVKIEAKDEEIEEWAKKEDVEVEELIDILKDEAESTCKIAGRKLSTSFEFVEWEEVKKCL